MVAAKVRHTGGSWDAWVGVDLDHVRRDAEAAEWYDLETLQEISLERVQHLDGCHHGVEVVRGVEAMFLNCAATPYIPGRSVYYLGKFTTPQPVV